MLLISLAALFLFSCWIVNGFHTWMIFFWKDKSKQSCPNPNSGSLQWLLFGNRERIIFQIQIINILYTDKYTSIPLSVYTNLRLMCIFTHPIPCYSSKNMRFNKETIEKKKDGVYLALANYSWACPRVQLIQMPHH